MILFYPIVIINGQKSINVLHMNILLDIFVSDKATNGSTEPETKTMKL
jgi:hypothetical protein